MSHKAVISEQVITFQNGHYKRLRDGSWQWLLFGTSGPGQNPHYFWHPVAKNRLPAEVLMLVGDTHNER